MKKYTQSHEWVELSGTRATIGISSHAQEELGDVVYVDLPEVGKKVKKGQVVCSIESVKAASDIYAPVDGEVVEINTLLDSSPETINQDAEGEGWIIRLEGVQPGQIEGLMDKDAYLKMIQE